MAFQPKHDPNPGFGRVPILDMIKAVGAVGVISVQSLVFALRSLVPGLGNQGRFKLFLIRMVFNWMPDSVLRRPSSLAPLFASKRYGPGAAAFVEYVDRPELSGFWLKPELVQLGQGASVPAEAAPVSEADVVVLFGHGGGYVITQPALFAPFCLRVMETAAARGQRVAVFLLDYGLAPEHLFPQQLRDMTAAWDYVVGEMGVAPAQLALMGNSAGGSLCLSFLAHRLSPLKTVPAVQHGAEERPGRGMFLLSPWLSMANETGYAEREVTDILPRYLVRTWGAGLIRDADPAAVQQYMEFAHARDDWAALLPAYTWVSAGANELFCDNVKTFATTAQAAGCHVDLVVGAKMSHDWQVTEALGDEKAFYAQAPGQDGVTMRGADALAEAVVSTRG